MRLIDADALFKDICDSINEMTKIGIGVDGEWLWAKLNDALENAPTIPFTPPEDKCSECDAWNKYKNYPREQRWIPVSEWLPEEHEWIGTKKFGTTISDEVYVTFENPKGERFCKHLSFQNGKLSNSDQLIIDAVYKGSKPIAWMSLPEPWKGEREEMSYVCERGYKCMCFQCKEKDCEHFESEPLKWVEDIFESEIEK